MKAQLEKDMNGIYIAKFQYSEEDLRCTVFNEFDANVLKDVSGSKNPADWLLGLEIIFRKHGEQNVRNMFK